MALDVFLIATLALSFAVLVTAHVAVAFGLSMRPPRWRGPVALIVAPLAPYFGMKAGLKGRSIVWLAALTVYGAARIAAALP